MPKELEVAEQENPAGNLKGFMESFKSGMDELEKPAPVKPEEAPVKPAPEPTPQPTAVKPEPRSEAVKPAPAEETEDKWPRTSQDWDRFKSKRKERETALQQEVEAREQRLKEMETSLTELQQKAASTELPAEIKEQLERLKKENEEYSNRIIETEVTMHPKFQEHFGSRTKEQVDLAKRIVGADMAEEMERVLKLPDTEEFADIKQARLEAVMGNLNQIQLSRLGSVLNSLESINTEREREIAKAHENRDKIQAQRSEAQKGLVANHEKLFSDVTKQLQGKDGFPAVQPREGDDAWNQSVQQRIERAKDLLFGRNVTPQQLAQASIHAASMPAILQAYKQDITARDSEIAKLQEQVKALSKAQPGGGGGGGGSASAETTKEQPKAGDDPFALSRKFAEGIREAWNK